MDYNEVTLRLFNNSFIHIDTNGGTLVEIAEEFAFFVPGYKWMPKFRSGFWDGKIKLFDARKQLFPAGLFSELEKFLTKSGYKVVIEETDYGVPGKKNQVRAKEIKALLDDLNLHSKGNKIDAYDYQFNAICQAIQDKRNITLSPTGTGKSLIIYCLCRWFMEQSDEKILLTVPTTSLVEQMFKDFKDYSEFDDSFDVNHECHMIYSGKEKINVHHRIFISTWQSIYKLPQSWFVKFGCMFGDECHLYKAQSLTTMMNKMSNCSYRIGTTGTLDGTETNEMQLKGLFGSIRRATTTKKEQENGRLAMLDIKMVKLRYATDTINSFGKSTYPQELDWITRKDERNHFIKDLVIKQKGNSLVLFQYVEKHGRVLYDLIKAEAGADRKVYFIHGGVATEDREQIRAIVESETDAIIVASFGTYSTGINIKNLHNLFFTSPSKSIIRILQSIGRGLRVASNGARTRLFDLYDDLRTKGHVNYSYRHALEREKIYKNEEFPIKKYEVKLD